MNPVFSMVIIKTLKISNFLCLWFLLGIVGYDVIAVQAQATADRPPNILLLITDDQDVVIGGMDHMPQLQELLIKQGTTFSNAFVHTPVCCPSRTSILTGRYIHNGGAINNSFSGNCGGTQWRQQTEKEHSFAVHLSKAGYRTAYIGKYLNQYGYGPNEPYVPPGWDRWRGLKGNSVYYNYTLIQSDDGGQTIASVKYGDNYATDYLPNIIANTTRDWIMEFSASEQPFLIVAGYPSPHTPLQPAPQYKNAFDGYCAQQTPNWNSSKNGNKAWLMRQFGTINETKREWIDGFYRKRLSLMLSVDDHITFLLDTLNFTGQLENTYIIYTSDNGYQLGQHRANSDKRLLYEHNIKVPFIVRGPNVPKNVLNKYPVLNIDIAPTLVEIATGVQQALDTMDGMSFLPLFQEPKPQWRQDFLISYHGEGDPSCGCLQCPMPPMELFNAGDCLNNTYDCVRILDAENLIYCRFADNENFVEFYNLTSDPWQLENLAKEVNTTYQEYLDSRIAEYKTCSGSTCRRLSFNNTPFQKSYGPSSGPNVNAVSKAINSMSIQLMMLSLLTLIYL